MVEIGLVVLFMVLLEFDPTNCITLGFSDVFGETGATPVISRRFWASRG
jgi:hypothetical protein